MAYPKSMLVAQEDVPGENISILQDATGSPKTSPIALSSTTAVTIVVPASCTRVTFEGFATNTDSTAHIRIYSGATASGGYWALFAGKQIEVKTKGYGTSGFPTQFTLVNSASASHSVNIKYDCMTADGS
jgi:hypothetical protein